MSAKISWLIYEDEAYMPYNTYMADGEDNFLLNLIEIRLPGSKEYVKPTIDIDRAVLELGTLYGDAGGTYKEIEIKIGPIPENMKSELKSLVFYLDY